MLCVPWFALVLGCKREEGKENHNVQGPRRAPEICTGNVPVGGRGPTTRFACARASSHSAFTRGWLPGNWQIFIMGVQQIQKARIQGFEREHRRCFAFPSPWNISNMIATREDACITDDKCCPLLSCLAVKGKQNRMVAATLRDKTILCFSYRLPVREVVCRRRGELPGTRRFSQITLKRKLVLVGD
ncbi:hypothetical protein PspLS_06046 [Pyricularia sp. CBS 133598]|nr:hypothetical protein PspLS_06046 [Pyricularia sp. CBS 133598]